ncbi:MAG: FhaA domain-containing protein [Candidatus Zipacnadales bacterium]
MSLLDRLESALAHLAEGSAERIFRGRLDLVAIGQELCNLAITQSRSGAKGPVAPNAYQVHLSLGDFGRLTDEIGGLQDRFALTVWARLREGNYGLTTPPSVLITPADQIAEGTFELEAEFKLGLPKFSLLNLNSPGTVYQLVTPATIGRGMNCDLRLTDPSVSREHVRVTWEQNVFVATDLSSTNGIEIDGIRLSRGELRLGAVLGVGNVLLRFSVDLTPSATPSQPSRQEKQEQ